MILPILSCSGNCSFVVSGWMFLSRRSQDGLFRVVESGRSGRRGGPDLAEYRGWIGGLAIINEDCKQLSVNYI